MKTPKFYFKVTMTYIDKNKLFGALREHVKSLDNTLIVGKEALAKFKKDLRAKIDELHAAHPRCNKIILDGWQSSDNTYTINVSGSWRADIYTVVNEI